jgi:hypothetical protein
MSDHINFYRDLELLSSTINVIEDRDKKGHNTIMSLQRILFNY